MYFIADVETTGLDETKTSLLTVHGQILDDKLEVKDEIDFAIKPNNGIYPVEVEALVVNKIDLIQHDKVAITETEAANKLLKFLIKHKGTVNKDLIVFVGHNCSLDIKFLQVLFTKVSDTTVAGFTWYKIFNRRVLDTGSIGQLMKLTGHVPVDNPGSLASLGELFGIVNQGAHTSKGDVDATREILKSMVRKLELIKEVKVNKAEVVQVPVAIKPQVVKQVLLSNPPAPEPPKTYDAMEIVMPAILMNANF
jgi:DNA polymerase III alpha subunit (gram-positive type)